MPLLGTYVEIAVPAHDENELRRWTDPAFARVAEMHAAMSFHSQQSDLAAISRACAGEQLMVRRDTWSTLRSALQFEAASDGLFNAAVAPELVRRGLLPMPLGAQLPHAVSARAALHLEGGDRVRVTEPVWIDLGGIAKGAAVDAAIAALCQAGAPSALVNAGGDLRAAGPETHTVWVRHAAHPGGLLAIASLSDGAFATSGSLDSTGWRHVVERAGTTPWPGCHSVSVAAESCLVADALTKIALLAGPAAAPLLRRYDARAVWIDADGRVHHA
jgi:thiamine biosynthesis lipoprotein